MAIDIKIVNASKFEDCRELTQLHDLFVPIITDFFNSQRYKNVNGIIRIYPNNLLFCGPTKDIDVLMTGEFTNFTLDTENYKNLKVTRFITTVELKSHGIDGIRVEGQNYKVKYPEGYHNVNEQCKKQLDLLTGFLKKAGIEAYASSLLWLYGITNDELNKIAPVANFAIAKNFTFDQIIEVIASQSKVYPYNGFINCSKHNPFLLADIDRLFAGIVAGKTLNDIRALNIFSQEKCKNVYEIITSSGNHTDVFSGKAGTGKTISLLQFGAHVSDSLNKRCLFLTYNKALVSDIKRSLRFAPYTYSSNIEVLSVQKFFRDIMEKYNLWEDRCDYRQSYDCSFIKLLKHLDQGNEILLDYSYVLIDEGQDWSVEEKSAILKLFNKQTNKIIVADGIDQFVTGAAKIDWASTPTVSLDISLRQKSTIVDFVNSYSKVLNIGWKVSPNPNLAGGTVTITNFYNSNLHAKLTEAAKELQCEEYDILFLIHGGLTDNNGFKLIDKFKSKGIHIFDGTREDLREIGYPEDGLSKCRMYNYASCRGLEGWVVICLEFDVWLNNMIGSNKNQGHIVQTYLKSLMPLTRAVDHLVITLKDPEGEIGKLLKSLCDGGSIIWDMKK